MTKLVGIINLTPDSFSDGGSYENLNSVLAQIEKMISEGAAAIDIGAESTRPGAVLLTEEDEWERLKNILPAIGKSFAHKTILSIDSRHTLIFKKALEAGFKWLNNVSGDFFPEDIALAKKHKSKLVLMHNLGVPADPKVTMKSDAVLQDIIRWAEKEIKLITEQGLNKSDIIFDPGIGFGKTAEQSIEIIENAAQLKTLGVEILIGHSRKSFLKKFTSKETAERDLETATVSAKLSKQEIDYLRVHNIEINHKAIKTL